MKTLADKIYEALDADYLIQIASGSPNESNESASREDVVGLLSLVILEYMGEDLDGPKPETCY